DLFYSITDYERKSIFFNEKSQRLIDLYTFVKSYLPKVKIIYPLMHEYDDSVFGTYSLKSNKSLLYQTRKYNNSIIDYASDRDDFMLLHPINYKDSTLNNRNNLYFNADLHFSVEYIDFLADRIFQIIKSLKAQMIKCIVLDLDNTLWGGIVGEDGPMGIKVSGQGEGKFYKKFQLWLRQLKERGIILTVCSKNDDHIAKEPFQINSEMILRLDDFALFVANWENKADNITLIKETLNIGYDSILFIDDNPAERDIVSQKLSMVEVPDLPEDFTDSLDFLIRRNYFEIRSISDNDKDRTGQYKAEFERVKLRTNYGAIDDYLKSLDMCAKLMSFTVEDAERISQLSLRSNQFNLRTIRYSKDEILNIMNSDAYLTYSLRLSDKFGDHGLVAIAIVKLNEKDEAFLDSLLMSCRVLKRGVEAYLMNKIVEELKNHSYQTFKGEYLPTVKNGLVQNFLTDHQFHNLDKNNLHTMELDQYITIKNYINESRD
ncbi:HAD-IIIC family phosphatase, partial [Schleiferiaceae bacterium]|nr:HAD-IIIC family phosphatase [Schleiferiaceae bacterium]